MGPKTPASTVLSSDEEAVIVAFRKHTLLPLDDRLYPLQSTTPHLTRSSPYRCLQRHGISRLPDPDALRKGRRQARQETLQSLSHRLGWLLGPVAQPGLMRRPTGSLPPLFRKPIITQNVSKHSSASHPTSSSAKLGQKNRNGSSQIRQTISWGCVIENCSRWL